MTGFDDAALTRYARHLVLREIGGNGQARLRAGRMLVVGAGGIGSPAIQYLAAAGVGTLIVIDDDAVALSNLQRQTLFGTADVGRGKVEVAGDLVARLNPEVAFIGVTARIDASNAAALIADAAPDVVIDGTDSFASRLAVADACHAARIPLVSAAVAQFAGQLAVLRGWEAGKPCYRCLVGDAVDRPGETCAEVGVLGALAGVMGSLAALEAIRQRTGFGEDSAGKLLVIDALSLRFRTLALPKDPGCRCAA